MNNQHSLSNENHGSNVYHFAWPATARPAFEEIKTVIEGDGTFIIDNVFQSSYTIKIERLK